MLHSYRYHIAIGILLGIVLGLAIFFSLPRNHHLRISFLDVGQGDAIFVQTPGGYDILVDGGRDDTVLSRLRDVMPYFDKTIDLVIATHPDQDHIGGLLPVFETYQIGSYIGSDTPSESTTDDALKRLIDDEESSVLTPTRGMKIIVDQHYQVAIDILFPDQSTKNFTDTNEASIIFRLEYGETSILLSGDSPSSVEQFLVGEYGSGLESDVLKLGHHGSKTSSAPLFLKAVSPTYAVASAGKNNSYNHPDLLIVKRAESYGAQVLSTQTGGTITFVSDGKTLTPL